MVHTKGFLGREPNLGVSVGRIHGGLQSEVCNFQRPVAQQVQDLADGLAVPLLYLGSGVVYLKAGFSEGVDYFCNCGFGRGVRVLGEWVDGRSRC